jgi:hypothetical protein
MPSSHLTWACARLEWAHAHARTRVVSARGPGCKAATGKATVTPHTRTRPTCPAAAAHPAALVADGVAAGARRQQPPPLLGDVVARGPAGGSAARALAGGDRHQRRRAPAERGDGVGRRRRLRRLLLAAARIGAADDDAQRRRRAVGRAAQQQLRQLAQREALAAAGGLAREGQGASAASAPRCWGPAQSPGAGRPFLRPTCAYSSLPPRPRPRPHLQLAAPAGQTRLDGLLQLGARRRRALRARSGAERGAAALAQPRPADGASVARCWPPCRLPRRRARPVPCPRRRPHLVCHVGQRQRRGRAVQPLLQHCGALAPQVARA